MKTMILMLTLMLILLSACYNRNYPQNNAVRYPKTNPDEIVIYHKDIQQNYEVISLVGTEVEGDRFELLNQFKKKAAKLGADAIIHVHLSGPNHYSNCIAASGIAIKMNQNIGQLSVKN